MELGMHDTVALLKQCNVLDFLACILEAAAINHSLNLYCVSYLYLRARAIIFK
jgi:hypothetical protein